MQAFSMIESKSPMAALAAAIDALPPGPKPDSIQKLKSFAESMTTLKTIADVMKSFEGMGGAEVPTSGGGLFQGAMKGLSGAIATGKVSMKIQAMKTMLEQIGGDQGFKTLDEPIKNAAAAVSLSSATLLTDLKGNLDKYKEALSAIPNTITGMADALPKELGEASIGNLSTALANFETQIKQLSNTKTEKIAVTLGRTLDTLGVKGAKYTVEAKPINITVDLSIIMKAGDVADGIAKSSNIIKHRIEQLAVRSGVQNYDISQTVPVVEK